jgi:hypothetical protein
MILGLTGHGREIASKDAASQHTRATWLARPMRTQDAPRLAGGKSPRSFYRCAGCSRRWTEWLFS